MTTGQEENKKLLEKALLEAIGAKNTERIKRLLEMGMTPPMPDTMLSATATRSKEVLMAIIDSGVQIPPMPEIILGAIETKSEEMVMMIIDAGGKIPPNTPNILNKAVLHFDNPDIIKALVDAGADVNIPAPDKYTPLQDSVYLNKPKMARALLECGADINGKGADNQTPLEHAQGRGIRTELKELLEDAVLRSSLEGAPVQRQPRANRATVEALHRQNLAALDKILDGKKKAPEDPSPTENPVTPDPAGIQQLTRRTPFGDTGRVLVEVFNFSAREKTAAIYDPARNIYESLTQRSFDDFQNKTPLKKAFDEYKSQGGTLDEDVIYNTIEERKKKEFPGVGT